MSWFVCFISSVFCWSANLKVIIIEVLSALDLECNLKKVFTVIKGMFKWYDVDVLVVYINLCNSIYYDCTPGSGLWNHCAAGCKRQFFMSWQVFIPWNLKKSWFETPHIVKILPSFALYKQMQVRLNSKMWCWFL